MLFIFEDNEAVIKMIIQGKSPTMRHASGTHRVALDWLFDRINLDPKIQTRYIDNKHQLADILIESSRTGEQPLWPVTERLNIYIYTCAKTYIFSDSVLCLGGMSTDPIDTWNQKIHSTHYLKDLDRIDGQRMEFEWKSGFTWVSSKRFKT